MVWSKTGLKDDHIFGIIKDYPLSLSLSLSYNNGQLAVHYPLQNVLFKQPILDLVPLCY